MDQVTTDTKRAYSIREFCAAFNLSEPKFYRMLNGGEITAKKVGRRTLIDVTEAERWFSSLPNAKAA